MRIEQLLIGTKAEILKYFKTLNGINKTIPHSDIKKQLNQIEAESKKFNTKPMGIIFYTTVGENDSIKIEDKFIYINAPMNVEQLEASFLDILQNEDKDIGISYHKNGNAVFGKKEILRKDFNEDEII